MKKADPALLRHYLDVCRYSPGRLLHHEAVASNAQYLKKGEWFFDFNAIYECCMRERRNGVYVFHSKRIRKVEPYELSRWMRSDRWPPAVAGVPWKRGETRKEKK